jgi:hypothetical protein
MRLNKTRFLVAALHLDQLRRYRTRRAVISVLEPRKSLNELYARLINEISEDNRPLAINALQWLTFAIEPLSVHALEEAVAVDPLSSSTFTDEDRLVRPYDIVDILQQLVIVSHVPEAADGGSTRVKLIHQSLVEFLEQEGIIKEQHAHSLMAQSCLEYITYYAHSEKKTDLKADSKEFPFLLYACKHWMTHARRSSELRSQNASTESTGFSSESNESRTLALEKRT